MFLNIDNPVYNTIVVFSTIMLILYITKPDVVYDNKKNEFRQFGTTSGKTLLPIYVIGILLAIILYVFFHYLSIKNNPKDNKLRSKYITKHVMNKRNNYELDSGTETESETENDDNLIYQPIKTKKHNNRSHHSQIFVPVPVQVPVNNHMNSQMNNQNIQGSVYDSTNYQDSVTINQQRQINHLQNQIQYIIKNNSNNFNQKPYHDTFLPNDLNI